MQLQQIRKARGYTQSQLASVLGISATSLSHIERGYVLPRAKTRYLIEKILGYEFIEWPYNKITERDLFAYISRYIGKDVGRAERLKEHIERHKNVIKVDLFNYNLFRK